jgi:hypothetical protein
MSYFGKWYESNGAGRCRYWYFFGIGFRFKGLLEKKPFGYWNIYYDGYFHYFNIWPFYLCWLKRPITELEYIESHMK